MSKGENRFRLALRVRAERVGLYVAFVLEQSVQDVDRFPDATRDEVTEESNVCVGDMVVTDAAVADVTDVIFRE
jgi:hypothetical protein